MRSSTPSSSRSANCRTEALPLRLEWRPSRIVQAMLAVIGICACLSLWLSELPGSAAAIATLLVILATLWRLHGERRAPIRALAIDASGVATLDGAAIESPRLEWRGPIAVLCWREAARRHRLLWWPDTLPPAARRELRLAASALATRPSNDSMAP